ncbi:thermonuclease family protein [Oceanibacterium hippocampi]|uniref:TNase-like domain-containing protein n=1 Tax=Oceanibacterium hippocampi TaxID=745714 RepID=A0A1Y5REJ7_9PROT|nr:hypothetical protein [Oceanibacterium hippocampi]SLN15410.1 hypothetical protein OCH7691_00316 [Oceanibacterium hippocampi]
MIKQSRPALAVVFALLASLIGDIPVSAAETLPGPIPARVLRVVDGDTIEVSVRIWLATQLTTLVRIDGLDTPELRGRCPGERILAKQARDFLRAFADGREVSLTGISYGKYAGRILATVTVIADTERSSDELAVDRDVATVMQAAGFGRPYWGGRRATWCED